MKVTLYYKGLAAILTLFVLLIACPSHVRADEVDIKPCYECTNCVIDQVTLEPVPPEGVDAIWVACSDPPAINLCSKGLTVVGVINFGFEIGDSTDATFLTANSVRYSVEDVDHDGAEDDLVYFFKTKDLNSEDGTLQACLQINNPEGVTITYPCDTVVLFSKGRCE